MQFSFILVLFVFISVYLPCSDAFFRTTSLVRSQQLPRSFLEMRERKCDLTGKRRNSKAMSVSKSMQHTHRVQHVNLQWCKLWWEEGQRLVRLRIATSTLRTIRKNGLHAVAKKYGVNLMKFAISTGTGRKLLPVNETLASTAAAVI